MNGRTSPIRSRRRPRFLDRVLLDGVAFRVVAALVAPSRGFWLRPLDAADASADRLLTVAEWEQLAWHTGRQRWEAAA